MAMMPNNSAKSNPIPQSTPFQLDLSDDALVTFGAPVNGGLSFHDVGYMPVNRLTIGGSSPSHPPGQDNLFIRYAGDGVQYFNDKGQPTTAVYSDLHYELVSYNGAGKFRHAADGTPTVYGVGNPTVLAQGDLIEGQLTFSPSSDIDGQVKVTYQTGGQTVGTLDISVYHPAGDIHYLAGGLTLDGGASQAIFTPLPIL